MEMLDNERDEQINKLVDTINQLAQLFKQMNELVIEQGTILDRIDYNMEQALFHTRKGKEELVKVYNLE
jgi:syntaxin 16